ncbi:hypothetical protein MJO28_001916 [Puccinia striiformis f. sp. tritici]|uniref:GTP cyclohydrolase II n=2 Tax=Puccinia striiformis f. sp. tritici TaxID=168172 RepID=A0A0L0VUC9_9BASI|nr:hypothetical protein Pst134EA_002843 [Puccinia striiformis f. sp. tritici]KAH9464407.1 hypothetical protein Pst134EB_003935 [Puccinia striiformis f. sp. tritici]KAH9472219.1 hypothetical protein Pst134EA_002843 [Puccinia striiformis f. sp. tritici]KAI7961427.1 hypothetical protein MJO28_001916 [Puccinia striiformis f. sp. tritici]KNF02889.1 hypothetical protein PSTG_03834 [Puccinia striiformis f. sp. tritici PST-78]
MTVACLPLQNDHHHHQPITAADLSILSLLTKTPSGKFSDRRPRLDPLILETAALSSPAQTRNHYLHQYHHSLYQPRQPQSQQQPQEQDHHPHSDLESTSTCSTFSQSGSSSPRSPLNRRPSTNSLSSTHHHHDQEPLRSTLQEYIHQLRHTLHQSEANLANQTKSSTSTQNLTSSNPLRVKCQARTRIPTPDGQLWLHLYTNNQDQKEHLAFVIDRDQMSNNNTDDGRWIRSTSLDEVWSENETEIERLIRGAYVGRLTNENDQHIQTFYRPNNQDQQSDFTDLNQVPIVRIHSECFTGETIGSQRCDCGEQLTESIRHIFNTPPYKGAIIYLRQEGRGIGLLNKIKAYNLQELGFDTLESNLILGFDGDLRDYNLAYKILIDLKLFKIRLMTNNPNKIEALTLDSNINVLERIPMIPSHWQSISISDQHKISRTYRHQLEPLISKDGQGLDLHLSSLSPDNQQQDQENMSDLRRPGSELDIYLRTKVNRMRHLIPLPPSSSSNSSS